MTDPNPFYPGCPVDPEFFVGRGTILNAVSQTLLNEGILPWEDMEILGSWGRGKTSTLLKIGSMAPKANLTVYIPCIDDSESRYLGEFLFALERDLQVRRNKQVSFADLFNSHRLGEKSGRDVVIEALARIDNRSILLLLDDSDLIPKDALVAVKSALYQLRLGDGNRVMAVFASKESISEKLNKAGLSPAEAHTRAFGLKDFTSDEVYAILRQRYSWWTERSLKTVFKHTLGHPLLVQVYGSAYFELAESDSTFRAWRDAGHIEVQKGSIMELGALFCDAKRIVSLETTAQEIIEKCEAKSKEALWQWYRKGWNGKPSSAEWKVALTIANLGGKARFIAIKKACGGNPGPQIKRAVAKGIIEQIERGLYAIPHPKIAQILRETSTNPKACAGAAVANRLYRNTR